MVARKVVGQVRLGDSVLQDQQRRFEESGQSVAAFCRDEGTPVSTFYQRRARLKKVARKNPMVAKPAAFIDAGAVTVAAPARATLRSARVTEMTPRVDVRIELGDGVVLHLTRS